MSSLLRCLSWGPALGLTLWLLLLCGTFAETPLPALPENYFNDYAGVVPGETSRRLDDQLRQFERDTSNQLVVAVFRRMETDTSIVDYSQRIFDAWKVGQPKLDNGAVLIVFVENRQLRIHTGYGLEGALPDITAKQIIEDEITPAFRVGDYATGIAAGVEAMMKATRGEYQGRGKVAGDRPRSSTGGGGGGSALFITFFAFIIIMRLVSLTRGTTYDRRGRHRHRRGVFFPMMGGGSWGGGSFGGGSSWAAAGAASRVAAVALVAAAQAAAGDLPMKPQEFFAQLDDAAVLQAIDQAERLSSGEIRVYVQMKQRTMPCNAPFTTSDGSACTRRRIATPCSSTSPRRCRNSP
jgi:uncharacterized protein